MKPQPQGSLHTQHLQDEPGRRGRGPQEAHSQQVEQVPEEVEADVIVLRQDLHLPATGKEPKRWAELGRRCGRWRRCSVVPVTLPCAFLFPASYSTRLRSSWPQNEAWDKFTPPSRNIFCFHLLFDCAQIFDALHLKVLLRLPELFHRDTVGSVTSKPRPDPRGPPAEALGRSCRVALRRVRPAPRAQPPPGSAHHSWHSVSARVMALNPTRQAPVTGSCCFRQAGRQVKIQTWPRARLDRWRPHLCVYQFNKVRISPKASNRR